MFQVTPTGRHCITYDEESWKPTEEVPGDSKESSPEATDVVNSRPSKTKRVKNYLKKCKNALGNRSSTVEITTTTDGASSTCSWYVNEVDVETIEYEERCKSIEREIEDRCCVATVIEVHGPKIPVELEDSKGFTKAISSESLKVVSTPTLETISSPLLPDVQETVEGTKDIKDAETVAQCEETCVEVSFMLSKLNLFVVQL